MLTVLTQGPPFLSRNWATPTAGPALRDSISPSRRPRSTAHPDAYYNELRTHQSLGKDAPSLALSST